MSAPPKTVLAVTHDEAEAIREAVRNVDVASLGMGRARAELKHVPGLVALLSDERVSGPIYDLPRPINTESITRWVAENQAQALAGEALLLVTLDEHGEVVGYSRITVWPSGRRRNWPGPSRRISRTRARAASAWRAPSAGFSRPWACG